MVAHRVPEGTGPDHAGGCRLRAGQMGDPPMAQIDEVLHRQTDAGRVVGGDGGDLETGHAPVHQHHLHPLLVQAAQQRVVQPRRGHDQPLDLSRAE